METGIDRGYLVLADISGYTSYLAGTELEHAQGVLSELLELIVDRLTPVVTISKLEGDAVFAYLPEGRLSRGETLLEMIEATYAAFKDRVDGIRRRTTCPCNACRAIPSLDLKFIVHFGEYVVQRVSTTLRELVGSDVNLVHRLLKNGVAEATGWHGYALFTEQALARMDLRPDGLHRRVETYEHLGQVVTFSLDLLARYQAMTEARRVIVDPRETHAVYATGLPAPPQVVWEWLNDPDRRSRWRPDTHWKAAARPGGRTGPGARNHCAHGQGQTTVEVILDWRPFDYYTADTWLAAGGRLAMREMQRLEPMPAGTRLHTCVQIRTPLPGVLNRLAARPLLRMVHLEELLHALAQAIAEEQDAAPVAGADPAPQ